jgi:hypothetical protein
MGYGADAVVCPLRMTCERHIDIPPEPSKATWAEHLCRLPQHAAYAPTGEDEPWM